MLDQLNYSAYSWRFGIAIGRFALCGSRRIMQIWDFADMLRHENRLEVDALATPEHGKEAE